MATTGNPSRDPVPDAGSGALAWAGWQRDRLEGVANGLRRPEWLQRSDLLDALNAAIREATATGRPAAAIFLDLNDFAEINAAWGPQIGDEVLAAAGRRIAAFAGDRMARQSLAATAISGRLDADHFAVVVPAVDSLEGVKAEAAALVRQLAQPVDLAGQTIAVGVRAALLVLPAQARSVTTALGRGFRLLNAVARASADGVATLQEEAAPDASALMLDRDLAAALSTDQLFIALQPKFDLATGAVRGAEALARWRHPERGMLPPPLFIQSAEKSGLIVDLGLRILRDSCRASIALAKLGRELSIAVNVSPHQLANPDFLGRFLKVVDQEGVKPENLAIEVTETAAMMGGERVSETLEALRRCGIGVAIDDFGTGFSNLASLSALPADTLKIDRSLVVAGGGGGKAAALLEIAVQLGRTFGMATVAEGVETTEQLRHVTELGCDQVQGYFTGRPVKAAEFAACYLGDELTDASGTPARRTP